MPRRMLLGVLLLTAAAAVGAESAPAGCQAPHRIEWPAAHPVWSFCWVSPDESGGVDGSGIELRDVRYKGVRILERAGVPLINVDYDPGGCGAYRDWQQALMSFEADHPVGPPGSRYAEPTSEPRTMCDHVGVDRGDFQGVAAWKTDEQLVLVTQLQAGPYRYVHRWTFRLDGTIEGRIAFTSRFDPCNGKPHNHHAYWRLELAPLGKGEERTEEEQAAGRWRRIRSETSRRNDPARGEAWRVWAPSSGRGYEIRSSPANGVADAWGRADSWVLAPHPNEIDDGGALAGPRGASVQVDRYLDGERLDGKPPVIWIHAADRHEGSVRCRFVGPTLTPAGNW